MGQATWAASTAEWCSRQLPCTSNAVCSVTSHKDVTESSNYGLAALALTLLHATMATSAANVSLESLLLSINALETKVKEIEERRTSGAKPSNRENKAARSVLKSCLSENAAIAYRIRDSTALDDEQRTSALKRISDLEHLALYGYFSRRGDDGIDPVDPYHRNLYIDREGLSMFNMNNISLIIM